MDELLRGPQELPLSRRATDIVSGTARFANRFWRSTTYIFRNTVGRGCHHIMSFFDRHRITPLTFLVVSLSVGVGATIANNYDDSFVVNVDGVDVGIVHSVSDFEHAIENVEARATRILGHDYSINSAVTYTPALSSADSFTSAGKLETYLFNQIGELVMGYDLLLDDEVICSADNMAPLEDLVVSIATPYLTANTTSYSFQGNFTIRPNYITSESNMDLDSVYKKLTANTTGKTTYTVVSGDTYSEIAVANDMTLDELMTLNPTAELSSLFVGDVLNVKKVIPYLTVYTIDNVTYEEVVKSPVEYVDDNTMYQGNTKVITQGTDGLARINADISYVNGYEKGRTVVSSETIIPETKTVIARGTLERPKTASTGTYIRPCTGWISSPFGSRYIFGSYSFHGGIDIANYYGTAIVASDGGLVTYSGWNSGGYGYLVVITHDDGSQTFYGHNSSLCVSVGERVYQGQLIAQMGSTGRSTGTHCHFEIRINGNRVNPENYVRF